MGRSLGIRSTTSSEPYAAINTADDEQDYNDNEQPFSPTGSGLSFENDDEEVVDFENNNGWDNDDDDDYVDDDSSNNIATQSFNLQHQLDTAETQSNERCMRVKFVLFFSLLAAMVIFGKEYYNIYGSDGSSESTTNTVIVSDEFTVEEYNGMRGKSTPHNPSDKKDDISSSSFNYVGDGGSKVCQDDPDFIYQHNGKSCANYVGKLDKKKLLEKRCSKQSGIMTEGSSGGSISLLIKDFCKSSCGLCDDNNGGDNKWWNHGGFSKEEEKEIIKDQIEEDVEDGVLGEEIEGVKEEIDELTTTATNEGNNDVDVEELIDEEEYIEFEEEELEEDKEFLKEDMADITDKIEEAKVDDDGLLAEEKEEYIEELEEEYAEDTEMEKEVESLQGEIGVVEELEEELEQQLDLPDDYNSEGGEEEQDNEKVVGGSDTDYFVPLTPKERDQMKEKLKETLLQTKNALRMSASVKNRMALTDHQRTFTLSTTTPKQFMHNHHMKTGGTSVDGLIRCALNRQKELNGGTQINYNSMSECGSRVRSCMNTLAGKLDATLTNNVFYHNDEEGTPFDPADEALDIPIDDFNVCKTSESSVMSYCASLHAVRTFGWKAVDKITVIRNPIDRAWSMYRFTLQRCYKCNELKDVLKQIQGGTFGSEEDEPNFAYEPNNSCAVQLIGHQATNLLSSVDLYNVANDVRFPREEEIIKEAIKNLREEFTWIGLTDRIQESVDGFRTIFPFLADNLSETAKEMQEEFEARGETLEDTTFALPDGYSDTRSCPFEHRNAGRDPTCGTTELDDETKEWIMKLNKRDMAVYKAAVERFEMQMEVLQEYKDGVF
jgi:hypothetical protein